MAPEVRAGKASAGHALQRHIDCFTRDMPTWKHYAMSPIMPLCGETPLDFVERADALEIPQNVIDEVLVRNFGFSDQAAIKALKLQSRPFWNQFYLDRVREIFDRGGARYAAKKFVQRKNDHADDRRKLSDAEIENLVDSVGEWPR